MYRVNAKNCVYTSKTTITAVSDSTASKPTYTIVAEYVAERADAITMATVC